jgi:hypothetical protein
LSAGSSSRAWISSMLGGVSLGRHSTSPPQTRPEARSMMGWMWKFSKTLRGVNPYAVEIWKA